MSGLCKAGHCSLSGRSRQGSPRPLIVPLIVAEAWRQQPAPVSADPKGGPRLGLDAIGSAALPSTPQLSYPCTRTSYTHTAHPHTCAHTRTPCPALRGEMWKGLRAAPTDSCGRMRFRDEDAEEGCGSRRFAAAARAERGRGRAPDRGCCCRGDAGWGRGARACCTPAPPPTRAPIRAAPGPQSLTPAQTLARHSRRNTHLASRVRFLRLGIPGPWGRTSAGAQTSLPAP